MLLNSFLAYDELDADGVLVATGHVIGSRGIDIVTSPGPGIVGAEIRVFENVNKGEELVLAQSITPFESWFARGASVAVADVNDDGFGDIVAGRLHGKAEVAVFDAHVAGNPVELARFLAFDEIYREGIHVATGNYLGSSTPDIIISTGYNGQSSEFSSQVLVFDGSNLQFSPSNPVMPGHRFGAFVDPESNPRASLRLVGKDFDLDGNLDGLFAVQGRYGQDYRILEFEPFNDFYVDSIFLADTDHWNEGYFVG